MKRLALNIGATLLVATIVAARKSNRPISLADFIRVKITDGFLGGEHRNQRESNHPSCQQEESGRRTG